MARVIISEFAAKRILYKKLHNQKYQGLAVTNNSIDIKKLPNNIKYAIKVDQATKKRGKNNLIYLDVTVKDLNKTLKKLAVNNFEHFLVEPMIEHSSNDEQFLAIYRVRDGFDIIYSQKGGINVEENAKSNILTIHVSGISDNKIREVPIESVELIKLLELMDEAHICEMELNPFVVKNNKLYPVDAAIKVDSEAESFCIDYWDSNDYRSLNKTKSIEEVNVAKIAENSPASFNLNVLNSDGSIFLLLSGGGASVVVADEIANHGIGK